MAYRGECNFCRVHLWKVQPSISPMFGTLLFHAKPSTAFLQPIIRSVTSCYKLHSDLIQFCAATKYISGVVCSARRETPHVPSCVEHKCSREGERVLRWLAETVRG